MATAFRGARDLVSQTKEKVDQNSHFSHLALKWNRITTGMVKLNSAFLGIFDRAALTLTVRVEDSLEKGELVESEHLQYRVAEVRPGRVQVPLEYDSAIHSISCRVAILARV